MEFRKSTSQFANILTSLLINVQMLVIINFLFNHCYYFIVHPIVIIGYHIIINFQLCPRFNLKLHRENNFTINRNSFEKPHFYDVDDCHPEKMYANIFKLLKKLQNVNSKFKF